MSDRRPDPHVAQQIRRDRLRIQNSSQHLEDFPSNIEHLSLRPGISPDLLQVRSVRNASMLYEPAFYSSEMVNFSTVTNPLAESSGLTTPQFASFPCSSNPASSSFHSALEEQCGIRNFGYWRNSGSPQVCDWMPNYASSSATNESNPNPNSTFGVGINNELSAVQFSLNNPSSGETATRESQRQLGEIHPNAMQDVIKSASIRGRGSEMASLTQQSGHGMWVENGNQLFFLPNYGIQSNQLRLGNPDSCTNRTIDGSLGFKASDECSGPRVSGSNNQGLSLSLSSNSQSTPCRSDDHQSRYVLSKDPQYSKPVRSVSNTSFSAGDRVKSLQNMVAGIPSSNIDYRNVGPLGPFTGYATILKNSNFLKPAQQLLEEICAQHSEKLTKGPDVSGRVSGEVGGSSTSADAVNAKNESVVSAKVISSGGSSSMFYCSIGNESNGDGGTRSSSRISSRPQYQQRMAKFLYMQEEVIKRYKQHNQLMQTVVSSFESVAGLSSATPYISKALKTVSRHFRFLENAISGQVEHIRDVLGEELSAPASGGVTSTTSGKLDSNMARLKFLDQSFQKNKLIVGGAGYLEHQQHAWRPQQKGLPERAVSILRAWLFDHFLHPYPTDADKHMLAARTGLSRNQVSNWFINARVRVWKPMVEEIHMLETKGLTSENDLKNANKKEGSSAIEGAHESRRDQCLSSNQFRGLEIGAGDRHVDEMVELDGEGWNQEKRSKLECHMTPSLDGTLMGFVPYRRGGVEVGGVGPVSLTLGLRHDDVEALQQHRHFGGHVINDFVG
ncbi:BEL1-like homeodomain protein 9 [Prosopis cineraria]|uniref:BEL1-like homeodomain protein 9 n=1 Tax=Prosopis cineraria TaxID=364024 RepID=UPI00240E9C90|nr:BEL1-like homeodomain protein 9 [Prosopis cineraria]XP_054811432.1 BEL1-like homeodomain protein 9 [Prosopis cineraria]